jgi:hypothetical protein
VTKFDPTGSSLVYSTYLGGSDLDGAVAIQVDRRGAAYVAGGTRSIDFPSTPGSYRPNISTYPYYPGADDGFATKLNPSGSNADYSTYLGGVDEDFVFGLAIDRRGSAYLVGDTDSLDFPTSPDAFDSSFNSVAYRDEEPFVIVTGYDGFLSRLDPDGAHLVYSTYLGGSGDELAGGVAADDHGAAYVTGTTESADFPTTPGAFDTSFNGGGDMFVTKLQLPK